jgi:hypothetical protein
MKNWAGAVAVARTKPGDGVASKYSWDLVRRRATFLAINPAGLYTLRSEVLHWLAAPTLAIIFLGWRQERAGVPDLPKLWCLAPREALWVSSLVLRASIRALIDFMFSTGTRYGELAAVKALQMREVFHLDDGSTFSYRYGAGRYDLLAAGHILHAHLKDDHFRH